MSAPDHPFFPLSRCSYPLRQSSRTLLLPSSPTSARLPIASFRHPPPLVHGFFSIINSTSNTEPKPFLEAFRFLGSRPPFTNLLVVQCTMFANCVAAAAADTAGSLSQSISQTGVTLFSLFQELGINDRETEMLLANNPALRFAHFEDIRARVRSLSAVGIDGLALSRLILKRPDVLTAEEIDPLICFLRDDLEGKIEPGQLVRLLNATEATFFKGFEEKIRLLVDNGVPREKLFHVLNNVNLSKALCLKSVEEIDRMISYLNHFGGVDLIIRRPAILNYDLDSQLIPRIRLLMELSGEDKDAMTAVLRKLPFILAYSVEHLNDHVEFLKSFAGLSNQEIFKIVRVYPNLFSASRRKKLHPRINFLKQCGLSSSEMYKFLTKAPLFISLSFEENLACKLVFLLKIGYENGTKELARAMGAVTRCSCKNLQEVIGLYLNYGMTCEDILAMSKKHSQVLQYNHKSLEEKMDYLVEEMGREVGELLSFPAFLGYKLDTRIKPRYEVKKKVLGEGMSLNKLLSVSTATFSKNQSRHPIDVLDSMDENEL